MKYAICIRIVVIPESCPGSLNYHSVPVVLSDQLSVATRITHSTATLIDNLYAKVNKNVSIISGSLTPIYLITYRYFLLVVKIHLRLANVNWDLIIAMELNAAYTEFVKTIQTTYDNVAPIKSAGTGADAGGGLGARAPPRPWLYEKNY